MKPSLSEAQIENVPRTKIARKAQGALKRALSLCGQFSPQLTKRTVMTRMFKPAQKVNANAIRLTGVFVSKFGKIKGIRTKIVFPLQNQPSEIVEIRELVRRVA